MNPLRGRVAVHIFNVTDEPSLGMLRVAALALRRGANFHRRP